MRCLKNQSEKVSKVSAPNKNSFKFYLVLLKTAILKETVSPFFRVFGFSNINEDVLIKSTNKKEAIFLNSTHDIKVKEKSILQMLFVLHHCYHKGQPDTWYEVGELQRNLDSYASSPVFRWWIIWFIKEHIQKDYRVKEIKHWMNAHKIHFMCPKEN